MFLRNDFRHLPGTSYLFTFTLQKMEKLNVFLEHLVATESYELRLEPGKKPYVISVNGTAELAFDPLPGPQISMMIFPLIPEELKYDLPNRQEIEFIHPHNLGQFTVNVSKSRAGFNVAIRPITVKPAVKSLGNSQRLQKNLVEAPEIPRPDDSLLQIDSKPQTPFATVISVDPENISRDSTPVENPHNDLDFTAAPIAKPFSDKPDTGDFTPPAAEYIPIAEPESILPGAADRRINGDRRQAERRVANVHMRERMEDLFRQMAAAGASDLHLSVSMPPMIRKDGKMKTFEYGEDTLDATTMRELLHSIMPEKNRQEFSERRDTDFAYEIPGLARFRCNIFMDRKGMGGVFRIIPNKILTAEELGLSKAIMNLCTLSKGLVVVTGPTGSGKSTTLCAMVDYINRTREDHIITIEDPIEFVHENKKCLINQREVHNHTDSFKDALRAALREDPDILLVGEMRDLETIAIAIETAETGHLVFGTLHTTTAASTVDRIIDQFPADRQQQIRVMLSESLKGVIAQTLLPKKGGGRVAALEVLIVTPAISNLIREGKTFQIPSAMQTGKTHGMVMLNDALYDLVSKGIVEPRDAYLKAVDKLNFETMLTRGGFRL